MNTYFGLMAEFNGRTELPLEEVAPRFFRYQPPHRRLPRRCPSPASTGLPCGGFTEKPVAGQRNRPGAVHR
nr:pyocin activator PrtN family protein [Halomonas olivaria]